MENFEDLDPWRSNPAQEETSAATCVRVIPRAIRMATFVRGTRNADIGGGRFDDVTIALAALGVENVVFDPFNRQDAHNRRAAAMLRGGQAASATLLNVLNVIGCPLGRDRALALTAESLGPAGTAYIQVYEGDRSGMARRTSRGWQENRCLASYVEEVNIHFASVQHRGGLLTATNPVRQPWLSQGVRWSTAEQAVAAAALAQAA